jgi:hypothetical protein
VDGNGGADAAIEAAIGDDTGVDAADFCPPPGTLTADDCVLGSDGKNAVWNGRCYFVRTDALWTHDDAKKVCGDAGAYLATVTCPAEQIPMPTRGSSQNSWVGGTLFAPAPTRVGAVGEPGQL